jgi:hypothetical protein
MVTSEPEVYSTTLPQNLRTTGLLISALANYTIGVQTLFANFAEIKANAERLGFPNVNLARFETIEEELR